MKLIIYLTKENIMKHLTVKTIIKQTFLLLLIAAFTTSAQKKDYSNEPGYVNFGNFDEFAPDDEVAEVTIEQNLLKMVSKLAGEKDKEMASLLGGLKLIKVNSFEVTKSNRNKILSIINSVDNKLTNSNWDRIVYIKKKTNIANIYIKTVDDNLIEGLVVTNIDFDGEASFVNIVGHIDLESIGRLSEKFNIPHLDKITGKNKNDENNDKKDK